MKKIFFLLVLFSLILFSCSLKVSKRDSIPIRYDGYLYLDVQLESKIHGNFVFDTGAPVLIIDSLFCKNNQLDYRTTKVKINGIGNASKIAQMITDTIRYKFENKEYCYNSSLALIFDLKSMVGENIDGILGAKTFAQKTYMLDYVSQNIIFTDYAEGYVVINSLFEDDRIYLPLTITLKNGKKISGMFLLDTGSDQTILNNFAYMTDGIHNSTYKKKFIANGGIGGDSNGYFLPIKEINIGEFKLKNVITCVSNDTLGMLANTDYIGIIGNDILDDFNIIFDHQKEKIWVKPNKNFDKNKSRMFRSISIKQSENKWIIAGIVEDTDAYKNGIRMNDQILEIDNVPVEKIELKKFVNKMKPNDVMLLKIKQGSKEREVKFKLDFFIKTD